MPELRECRPVEGRALLLVSRHRSTRRDTQSGRALNQQRPRSTVCQDYRTSSPHSSASRSLPFALFHVASNCCDRISLYPSVSLLQCPLTSIPHSLTCAATLRASGQSSGVPIALRSPASGSCNYLRESEYATHRRPMVGYDTPPKPIAILLGLSAVPQPSVCPNRFLRFANRSVRATSGFGSCMQVALPHIDRSNAFVV